MTRETASPNESREPAESRGVPWLITATGRPRFFRLAVHACLGISLATACAPDVAETPHASLQALSRAVAAGDTATTLQYVDVDAIVGRLIRDFLPPRDSLKLPGSDTLITEFRARIDSIEAELRAILRTGLGLPARKPTAQDSLRAPSEAFDDPDSVAPYSTDDVLGEAVEIVGDGAVRYVGDTALVARVLRYAHFDTSATLTLALVPVGRTHWRIVALHNAFTLAAALRERQTSILKRANQPLRHSIAAYATIEGLRISREPLEEWGRYAAEARATVTNRSLEPVVLHAVHLTGPHLSLGDSVGQLLARPAVLAPASRTLLVWRRPIRGDHPGLYDVVARPTLYAIEVADVEIRGPTPGRLRLYRSWEEFVKQNPLPSRRSRGVLASTSASRAELAVATVRRQY